MQSLKSLPSELFYFFRSRTMPLGPVWQSEFSQEMGDERTRCTYKTRARGSTSARCCKLKKRSRNRLPSTYMHPLTPTDTTILQGRRLNVPSTLSDFPTSPLPTVLQAPPPEQRVSQVFDLLTRNGGAFLVKGGASVRARVVEMPGCSRQTFVLIGVNSWNREGAAVVYARPGLVSFSTMSKTKKNEDK